MKYILKINDEMDYTDLDEFLVKHNICNCIDIKNPAIIDTNEKIAYSIDKSVLAEYKSQKKNNKTLKVYSVSEFINTYNKNNELQF